MPSMAGGASEKINPSLMPKAWLVKACAVDAAESSFFLRSDQSLRMTKVTPALERVALVSTSRPETVKLSWYAGCAKVILSTCLRTASVRCIDDAGGRAAMAMT